MCFRGTRLIQDGDGSDQAVSERFKVRDVVFVGDRGMLKRLPLESIAELIFIILPPLPAADRKLIKEV